MNLKTSPAPTRIIAELPLLHLEWESSPRRYGSCYKLLRGDILVFGQWLDSLGFRSARTILNPYTYEDYWLNGAAFTLWRNGKITCHDWWINVVDPHKIDVYALIAPLVVSQSEKVDRDRAHMAALLAR